MDLTESIAPRSDQQNYDDYVAGPKTVTISEVRKGTAEQPVEVHLVEFPGRPFKPSKTVRRILFAAWGPDSSVYAGRRMTLYGDPNVKFGGQVTGGIRVSHLSHIDKPLKVFLTVTRGKRALITVQPLPQQAGPGLPHEVLQSVWSNVSTFLPDLDNAARIAWISNTVGRQITKLGELAEADVLAIGAALGEGQEATE